MVERSSNIKSLNVVQTRLSEAHKFLHPERSEASEGVKIFQIRTQTFNSYGNCKNVRAIEKNLSDFVTKKFHCNFSFYKKIIKSS